MNIYHGKPLDSFALKRGLNKRASVNSAESALSRVPEGPELKACPLCDSEHFQPLADIYGFGYRRCDGCGCAFVVNPPTPNHLQELYNSTYYNRHNEELLLNDSLNAFRIEHVAKPKIDFVMKRIRPSAKSWLDIGCGTGENLYVVSTHSWKTTGIETNEKEAAYARRNFGLDVKQVFFSEANCGDFAECCNVVSLFGVLEHMTDPRSILTAIAGIQQKGDYIVIEVPNFPSISSSTNMAFPGTVNRVMLPPLHLFLFSIEAIGLLLKSNGYTVSDAWYFGQDVYELLSSINIYMDGFEDTSLYGELSKMVGQLQQVVDDNSLSDELLVIGRKTK